jgi:hypothetical protein
MWTITILSGSCFIHHQRAAHKQLVIETADSFFGLSAVAELNKSKASWPPRFPIRREREIRNRADRREVLS